jgi:hypothetical protein
MAWLGDVSPMGKRGRKSGPSTVAVRELSKAGAEHCERGRKNLRFWATDAENQGRSGCDLWRFLERAEQRNGVKWAPDPHLGRMSKQKHHKFQEARCGSFARALNRLSCLTSPARIEDGTSQVISVFSAPNARKRGQNQNTQAAQHWLGNR